MSSFCSAKATHIFSAKNIRILCIGSAKTVNEMTLNDVVKLMTLWTTGPRLLWNYAWTVSDKFYWAWSKWSQHIRKEYLSYLRPTYHICDQLIIFATSLSYLRPTYHICDQLIIFATDLSYLRPTYHICDQLIIFATNLSYLRPTYHICDQLRLHRSFVARRHEVDILRKIQAKTYVYCPNRYAHLKNHKSENVIS